jgi:hypothetical protein
VQQWDGFRTHGFEKLILQTLILMRICLFAFIFCIAGTSSFGQDEQPSFKWNPNRRFPPRPHRHLHSKSVSDPRVNMYMQIQYSQEIDSKADPDNFSGIGTGLQFVYRNKSIFKPTIDAGTDFYFDRDDNASSDFYFSIFNPLRISRIVANISGGVIIRPVKWLYLSGVAGPLFDSQKISFGVKPSVGVSFSSSQKFLIKISYVTVFKRKSYGDTDFNSGIVNFSYKVFR